MAKKLTKFIVRYQYQSYAFDSVSQAADAIKFFGKLKPVEFTEDPATGKYFYMPQQREERGGIQMEEREYRETKTQLALPAPKRGTVPCSVCESVSVRRGHACESCGTVAPL
jgi:hypothetical protein